jgi:hypothetical protein
MVLVKATKPIGVLNVRFGSKADMCAAKGHVRTEIIAKKTFCIFCVRLSDPLWQSQ